MAKILGSKGIITFAGLAGITAGSIDKQSDPMETTVLGAVSKTFIPGARSFTLDVEAISAAPALAESYAIADTLKSFEINGTAEAIDVSAIGDLDIAAVPFKSFIGGLPEWDATLEIDMNAGTPPPSAGSSYPLAGAAAFVQSCSTGIEVNGVIGISLSIKGSGALPAAIAVAPGGIAAFELQADADYIASGNAVVTAYKISAAVGGLVTYAITGQGTGILVETRPVP